MTAPLRVLYVGSLRRGGTCLQRMNAFKRLGHSIVSIDTTPKHIYTQKNVFFNRIKGKLFGILDTTGANKKIISKVKDQKFDIIWLDKSLKIKAETLSYIKSRQKNCAIVGYSPDDMNQSYNQSRFFLKHIHLYDLFFTTKSYNVKELSQLGCRNVKFVCNAYDPEIHHPIRINNDAKRSFGGRVGFIGSYERDRANFILHLAENGINVRIWGARWKFCTNKNRKMQIENKCLWMQEYAKAICSFDINLCFLRKCNRDLQTTRSIEIPACGGFMLAERSKEHLKLFDEGKEAEFFDTPEELILKTKYYLDHSDQRKRIASEGLKRCIEGGYSNDKRLTLMLEDVKKLMNN